MPQDSDSRGLDKVIVRLPDGMRDRLREAALAKKRSMTAEIVDRLDSHESLLQTAQEFAADAVQLRKELDASLAALEKEKGVSASLHHLVNDAYRDASEFEKQQEETKAEIGRRYDAMVEQYNRLEQLKAELDRRDQKQVDDLERQNDAFFKTINVQAETLEAQSRALKAQAALIGKLTSEQFYEFGRLSLDDVPDNERPAHVAALNEAMHMASEIFGFQWQPPDWRDDLE